MNCDPEPVAGANDRRRHWPLACRAAAGAAILIGILTTLPIDKRTLWGTLGRVNPWFLLASMLGFLLLMAVKSWRWCWLVRSAGLHYGFRPAYRSYLAAFSLGLLTPGRLGELARAAQLRRELGVELGPCVRSVVSDRFFDLLFLGAFGPVAFWSVMTGWSDAASFAVGFIGLYLIAAFAVAASGRLIARWQPRWRPAQFVVGCMGGVAGDMVGRAGFIGAAITFLSSLVYFEASQLLLLALGVHLSFGEIACVTGCLSLVLLLPISIAGIGPREATLIVLLGKYGVRVEDALAYSILQLGVFMLFGGVVGALALVAETRDRNGKSFPIVFSDAGIRDPRTK
jgi:glycosyltransferase 2 family protein